MWSLPSLAEKGMVSAVMGSTLTRTPRWVTTARNYDQLEGAWKRATEIIQLLKECRQAPEVFAKRALLSRYPKDTRMYLIHLDGLIAAHKDMIEAAPISCFDRLESLVLEYEQWKLALEFRTADLRRGYGRTEYAMQVMHDKMCDPTYRQPAGVPIIVVQAVQSFIDHQNQEPQEQRSLIYKDDVKRSYSFSSTAIYTDHLDQPSTPSVAARLFALAGPHGITIRWLSGK